MILANDGAWELVCSADNAQEITRVYGVDVHVPVVTVVTDNSSPFWNSLEVRSATTKGILFVSLDRLHWNTGADLTIIETSTVHFMAIDADGLPSEVVGQFYEKAADIQAVTVRLVEHFIAQRLSAPRFSALFVQFGANVTVTLFLINGEWVLNSETQTVSAMAPKVIVSEEPGEHTQPIGGALTAQHDVDAAPIIYYTLDGSSPTESSP